MNVNTGEIVSAEEAERANKLFGEVFEEVKNEDMTEKQKETKQVSLKDHSSKLGKQLTIRRSEPCFCGSGKKFKFCCRNKPKKDRFIR